jgi:hypothetical protein
MPLDSVDMNEDLVLPLFECRLFKLEIPERVFQGVRKNHGTQDSRVVPHRGTNWAALWLTAQIGRDAVLSESYGRGYLFQ